MKLGLYLFSEYVNMFISSAVVSTLFFGGYDIPFVDEAALSLSLGANTVALLGFGALFAKILFFLFLFIWVRWTIPRFRYDQLMDLGWKKLIPLALANMLITAVVILWLNK
jgi:NADH-quinone oxidoreductase subunit H